MELIDTFLNILGNYRRVVIYCRFSGYVDDQRNNSQLQSLYNYQFYQLLNVAFSPTKQSSNK